MISALIEVMKTENHENHTKEAQYEAKILTEKLQSLEITIMICFLMWYF